MRNEVMIVVVFAAVVILAAVGQILKLILT